MKLLAALLMTSLISEAITTTTTTGSPSEPVHDLYLMGLYPWTGAWHGGESLLAATSLGVKVVNNMTDVLPGYRLHIVPNDTQCDPGIGVKGLFEQLYTPPTKIMLLGAGCSIVSEATARASHLWNLVQLSYASVSPALSEKKLFPKFARVSAPDVVTNPSRVHFFRSFGWTRIATIHQTYELFSATTEDLIEKLRAANFTIMRSEIFRENPTVQVRNLKENDCRIIVGAFYADKARKVFCEAYKLGFYGRRYVWVLPGWYDADWWLQEDPSIDCTPQQLAEAVEGYFDAGIVYLNPNPERSVSGWLPSDFMEAYNASVEGRTLPGDIMAPQGFDAIWALSLALNNTIQTLREMGNAKRLENFTYEDREMSDIIYNSLLNVSFMGVRGPIAFDDNGDPVGLVKLDRVQGGVKNTVGLYNPMREGDDRLEWLQENPVVWAGGSPPRDSTVTRTVYVTLSVPLYATMCVLAAMGILLAVAFLIFNIVFRNVKIVKMSSPRINNVILLGCVCAYCSILVQDAGGGHGETGCEVKTALLSLGVSMTFGALFAKTWRVHVIFTNTKLQKRIVSDGKLLAMLGVLVMLNVIVLVTWWVVDPRRLQVTGTSSTLEEDTSGEVLVKRSERACVSHYQLYFLGTLYGIHALVLVFGIFLAWETRKVHYPELNDSKYIGMCIYNVALLCIPGVVVGVALDPGVNLAYAIESGLVLLGTTVTQCIIFVPKMMGYRQNHVEPDDLKTQATRDIPTVSTLAPPTLRTGKQETTA